MEIIQEHILDAWKSTLKHIKNEGEQFTDHDNRTCIEVHNLIVTITNPEHDIDRPMIILEQQGLHYPPKEELAAVILKNEQSVAYAYNYGSRIFKFMNQKDQINDYIIPLLKSDPHSRRAVVSIFNPIYDEDVHSKNVPSLMVIHWRFIKGVLAMTIHIRSNDFLIGWPGNVYQTRALQLYVAEKIGIPAGPITTISNSAHYFAEQQELVDAILTAKR